MAAAAVRVEDRCDVVGEAHHAHASVASERARVARAAVARVKRARIGVEVTARPVGEAGVVVAVGEEPALTVSADLVGFTAIARVAAEPHAESAVPARHSPNSSQHPEQVAVEHGFATGPQA